MFIANGCFSFLGPFMGGRHISLLRNRKINGGHWPDKHLATTWLNPLTRAKKGNRSMDLGLIDRVALVAAASRGIGYASARELAREGARVFLCSRDERHASAAAQRIHEETGANVAVLPQM
jgi:hypothetical protein